MIWLAVIFFCTAEGDCSFWSKATTRPIECERTLTDMATAANQAKMPIVYGSCIAVKGKDI
jgi:hypothetical protein